MSPIGIPELVMLAAFVMMAFVTIYPATTICRRLGFSPWLGVLAVVPVANLVLLWFVALSPWPSVNPGPRSI